MIKLLRGFNEFFYFLSRSKVKAYIICYGNNISQELRQNLKD